MSTYSPFNLPEPLWDEVQVSARSRDMTPEEFVRKAVENLVAATRWESALERTRHRVRELGIEAEDVEALIQEDRRERPHAGVSVCTASRLTPIPIPFMI